MPRQRHKIFVPFIFLSLITAVLSGVQLAGVTIPPAFLEGKHAPLIIVGFFSALISLERAVALRHPLTFVPTGLFVLSALLILTLQSLQLPSVLATVGSGAFSVVMLKLLSMQRNLPHLVMFVATLFLFAGYALWASGRNFSDLSLWWMGFLILTIAGERLELARLMRLTKFKIISFTAVCALFSAGVMAETAGSNVGLPLTGAGLMGLALWLVIFDIPRRTIKTQGLTRFIAFNLLTGYFWMGAGGFIAIVAWHTGLDLYDAYLHAVLLGFVFSMIFAHAPLVLESVGGKSVQFSRLFYVHSLFLNVTLAVRVAGALTGEWLWQVGVVGNTLAIALFFAITAAHVRSGQALQS